MWQSLFFPVAEQPAIEPMIVSQSACLLSSADTAIEKIGRKKEED